MKITSVFSNQLNDGAPSKTKKKSAPPIEKKAPSETKRKRGRAI
jgi:hypothetical protein